MTACAPVTVDTLNWQRITSSLGPLDFLLPPGLQEKRYKRQFTFSSTPGRPLPATLPVATQFWRGAVLGTLVEFKRYEWLSDSEPPLWLPDQRAADITQCDITIDGRHVRIRSYRSPGMINNNGTPMYGYVMEAALPLGPTARVTIVGSHVSPAGQRQTLAIIRSLRIRSP